MRVTQVRDYSKRGDALPIPNLIEVQTAAYKRFLQSDIPPEKRKMEGLEALLKEVFPIESYDGNMKLEYLSYDLGKPRYTQDECRALRLTFGMPFRVRVRLHRKDKQGEILDEAIYLGEIPIMTGGGEFIINGAERVIVSQLHRSPGVDFVIDSQEGDRPLHATRVIPERGSWIEINVTKKDVLAVRIDQSAKIPATTFLRAMDEKYSTNEALLRSFYETRVVPVGQLKPDFYAVGAIVDTETGEEIVKSGAMIGDSVAKVQSSSIKKVEVIERVNDPVILNTIQEDGCQNYQDALLKIYGRLRPGNPPHFEKAKTLFAEKFFDANRYRLGKVGRFRINRKFEQNVPEDVMTLRAEDILGSLKYVMDLRAGKGYVDDIDHLGNRRLRTIDELAAEELRKGFLKLRRTVQERMSLKDPNELTKIVELVNSKSISSSIEFFFGRSELSQVVDQTNPLSQLTHERRLSALGPGGLNRKRAGFEVRDVHISHYGRICPIETPEGTNIGLIASLSIYAGIDEYGFLITPYRVVDNGKVNGGTKYLRADEEMKSVVAPPEVVNPENSKVKQDMVLARVNGELNQIRGADVQYVDISPKQTVAISAALIPFLEHDDANRALMGSNMQRQAVPLLITDPPVVATGMEKHVPTNSGMVIKAERSGVVTFADARRIVIDNSDEYVLRKNAGLNDKTCLTQKPLVTLGQRVKRGQIIADGPACRNGELALGKNVLVAFMTYDGYNFEDAIVISERLVKEDTFTSIHIEEFDIEIRETKLGREEFTRDIPNVSEKALKNLDDVGIVRTGTRVGPGDILVGKVAPKSKTELSPEEKLLHAIFGRAGEDVKNDSLEVPAGTEGVVIGAQRFSRRMHMSDEQKKQLQKDMKKYGEEMNHRGVLLFKQMADEINEVTGQMMVDPSTRQKVGKSDLDEVILEQIQNFQLTWVKGSEEARKQAESTWRRYDARIKAIMEEKERKLEHMKRGDELPSGVLEMVKVYLATKRQLSVGDKMAGRHGNKGVIARIVPEEDMPFMEDGTSIDILLNPLGVPSRMNVGQILETHLGWAAAILGFQAVTPVFDGATEGEISAAVEEANKHVRERRRKFEGRVPNSEVREEIRKRFELKVVPASVGRGSLEHVESRLMVEYPAGEKSIGGSPHLPKWNKACNHCPTASGVDSFVRAWNEARKDEKDLFKAAKSAAEDGRDWTTFDGLDEIPESAGLYLIREKGKTLADGYVGVTGVGKMNLRSRLKEHYSGDVTLSGSFGKVVREELQKKLGLEAPPPEELFVEMPPSFKQQLYDGRTGEPFEQRTTVGYIYMLKLHHLVDDKIHARSTGPYSLITQQPLGGKARTGGQRFGEMEVWGLEAYGASYILQELLTVKSDDVEGRTKIYESMVKGSNLLEAGTPVSFDVLCNEIRGLGLNITLEKKKAI